MASGSRNAASAASAPRRKLTKRIETVLRHRDVLLELAALDKSERRGALERILAADATTLGVERVSYWSFIENGDAIECEASHLLSRGAPDPTHVGRRLAARDYPRYFAAVLANRPIVANRAQTDRATREFSKNYLRPRGITSMLDVPVWYQGKVAGVICHVHVGQPRMWTAEEIDFANSIADMASIALEAARRRELQEYLESSLAEREVILKTALVGISFAADRRHRWVNDTFARMLGYEKDELIGKPSRMHYPDQASWEAFGAEAYPALATGKPYSTERLFKRRDGTLFWCQISGIAVDPGDPSKGSIWTNVDVTERKRAEEEVRRALEKEKELNELKSRFVAMTSHEFRTPLATILSSAELLEHYGSRLPEEDKRDIHQSIRAAVDRMTKMLDNVLTIGRAEAQMLEFKPAPTDLAAFCEGLAGEMRQAAGGRHAIEYTYEGARVPVLADEKLLRHVLVNLISNACKYSPDGGPVTFRVAAGNSEACFEVADRGIGIPPEDQLRLFETFHRASNVGNIAGAGLGLAIVRKSLDLHGGSIEFDSAPGAGTRFRVTIPLGHA
jgi:PAS domain S-box-containing protein